MSRKRLASDQIHRRLSEVARIRLMTPSNKQLARESGYAESTVEFYIAKYMRELRESLVSRGADTETIG